MRARADPTETMAKLVPVAEHTFLIEANSGYSSHGEFAVFEIDDNGKVLRLKIGANYTYPVSEW